MSRFTAVCVLLLIAIAISSSSGTIPAEPSHAPGGPPSDRAGNPSGDWSGRVAKDLAAREYHLSWQEQPEIPGLEAAWQAPNRAHNLRTYFTHEGIRVVPRAAAPGLAGPAWEWGLTLLGYGRGGITWELPPATTASPTDNRIEYWRGGFGEWYENSQRGLKQGFVLPEGPEEMATRDGAAALPDGQPVPGRGREIEARDLVHIDLALSGDLSPVIAADGQAIDFVTPTGARVMRYAELVVTDARGEQLPAWMEGLAGEGLRGVRLVVDAREAVYPITIDPLATSPAWTAESDQVGARFGISVATAGDVNGDGYADVIVGAPEYDNGVTNEGRAYVYLGDASGLATSPAWTAESRQAGSYFGGCVATAGDVNGDGYADVIVGASGYDNGQSSPKFPRPRI